MHDIINGVLSNKPDLAVDELRTSHSKWRQGHEGSQEGLVRAIEALANFMRRDDINAEARWSVGLIDVYVAIICDNKFWSGTQVRRTAL